MSPLVFVALLVAVSATQHTQASTGAGQGEAGAADSQWPSLQKRYGPGGPYDELVFVSCPARRMPKPERKWPFGKLFKSILPNPMAMLENRDVDISNIFRNVDVLLLPRFCSAHGLGIRRSSQAPTVGCGLLERARGALHDGAMTGLVRAQCRPLGRSAAAAAGGPAPSEPRVSAAGCDHVAGAKARAASQRQCSRYR